MADKERFDLNDIDYKDLQNLFNQELSKAIDEERDGKGTPFVDYAEWKQFTDIKYNCLEDDYELELAYRWTVEQIARQIVRKMTLPF